MSKRVYHKNTKHEEIEHCDVLILGGGPAGITAAIYAARYDLKPIVIAKSIGGTANLAGEVENWPGFIGSGADLMTKFKEHAEKFEVEFYESEITKVDKDKDGFYVELGDKVVHGKSLILALGMEHRKLNIKGEKEFLGKGVSFCATCDGLFFKNKTVAVVGGSDSAAKAALYLSDVAKKVYVIYRKNEMRCEPISTKKLKEKKNVEFYFNSNPLEIVGDKKVTGLKINQVEEEKSKDHLISIDGVFIEIGATPMLEVTSGLKLKTDGNGAIIIDNACKTNSTGVFAAGDNTNTLLKQIVVAAGEGAIAAKSAYDFLKFGK